MRRELLLLTMLLSGCGTRFSPETLVEDLRVLAMTSEPPEVGPGETATLNVLYTDPQRKSPTSVLWVGCEPDPQDLGRSACNDATILLKPTTITDYPVGLQLLGFSPRAAYHSTTSLFDVLAPDSPIRTAGSVGQVIALVVGELVDPLATGDQLRGYFERIENKTTQAVVGLTRVLVSEKPLALRNHNPLLQNLLVDGVVQPPGSRLALEPATKVNLTVTVPDSSHEQYTEQLASGPVEKTETVVGAWYSTSGRFSRERFDLTSADPTGFYPPGSPEFPEDPLPERRAGTVWIVIRDNRGGQAFQTWPFFVCDHSLPAPQVTSVQLDTNNTVIATGTNAESILDVLVGGVALGDSGYSSARAAFIGTAPALASGTYPVTLRTKACGILDTGKSVTLP